MEEQKITTMDEKLRQDIYLKLKQLKDGILSGELEEMYIVDRFNSADFVYAFKDGLLLYREDVALCERLFPKDKCRQEFRIMYKASEAARNAIDKYGQYVRGLDFQNISEEEMKNVEAKLKEYKDILEVEENTPEEYTAPIFLYTDEIDRDLLVQPLSEISDENISEYCIVVAKFILAYFLTMRFMFHNQFEIETSLIKNQNYVDLIAIIKLK